MKAKAAQDGKKEEKAEGKPMEVEESEEEPEVELDFDAVDIFGVDDIMDVGQKVPLVTEFQFEDFALMSLRYELHLLAHAFSKDCNDRDRTGIHSDHLAFYYQKYFNKQLNFSSFGVSTPTELIALVNDTVNVTEKSIIESLVPAELESNGIFAKITEAARRRRLLQIEMGDESAKIKVKQGGGGDGNHNQGQVQKRNWEGAAQGGWARRW